MKWLKITLATLLLLVVTACATSAGGSAGPASIEKGGSVMKPIANATLKEVMLEVSTIS
ncbi:MAG: hypothetical protein HYX80_05850 [Chloroflexi bacterium]|nr:hypothetical protein [Chloroflexota bacterium]